MRYTHLNSSGATKHIVARKHPYWFHVSMIPERLLTILIYDCFHIPQSLLVAEAYKKRDISIWVDAVYHQVVIKGNFNYFQDMRSALPLSNSLFVDVANK